MLLYTELVCCCTLSCHLLLKGHHGQEVHVTGAEPGRSHLRHIIPYTSQEANDDDCPLLILVHYVSLLKEENTWNGHVESVCCEEAHLV